MFPCLVTLQVNDNREIPTEVLFAWENPGRTDGLDDQQRGRTESIRSENEDEVIDFAQHHAKHVHNTDAPRDHLRNILTDI